MSGHMMERTDRSLKQTCHTIVSKSQGTEVTLLCPPTPIGTEKEEGQTKEGGLLLTVPVGGLGSTGT